MLKGKVAIITGATRGIGKGVALKFAQNGADVAFTYVSSEEKAKLVEEELAALGVKQKDINQMLQICSQLQIWLIKY